MVVEDDLYLGGPVTAHSYYNVDYMRNIIWKHWCLTSRPTLAYYKC